MCLPCSVLKSTVESIYLDSGLVDTTSDFTAWSLYYRSIDKADKIE